MPNITVNIPQTILDEFKKQYPLNDGETGAQYGKRVIKMCISHVYPQMRNTIMARESQAMIDSEIQQIQ